MLISEVSEKYNLTQDTLRYYERVGLIPKVPRMKNGIRNYDEESCGWIEFIKCMRSAGLPIEALIDYVELSKEGNSSITARKQILVEERENLMGRIKEMTETLERLNYKISVYEEAEKTGELSWHK